jgi:hypothetical protein
MAFTRLLAIYCDSHMKVFLELMLLVCIVATKSLSVK